MLVICPNCGKELDDQNGSLAGQAVACPFCGQAFVMPAIVSPPPVPSRASLPSSSGRPRPRTKPQRPLAKRLMLAATICWPLLVAVLYVAQLPREMQRGVVHENSQHVVTNYDVIPRDKWEARASARAVSSAFVTATSLWIMAIVVLFVFWFATKAD